MLTDLEWRYARYDHERQQGRYGWGHQWAHIAMESKSAAFEDMEQRQFEQDCYDNFENPAPKSAFEHHQHHHELAEPVPQHQLDVERITQLLENTHG